MSQRSPTILADGSGEYRALKGELAAAHEQVSASAGLAREPADSENAAASHSRSHDALREREQKVTAREEQVEAREEKVAAVEERIAETPIGQGLSTVGVDVEPGTYRTAEVSGAECYWAIFVTGTSGSDVFENDIRSGGFPTVTLREGQDLENNGCGTVVKQ